MVDHNVCSPPPQLEVQVVLWGAPHHEPKPLSAYLQYLEHVGQNRPPPSAYELFARGYEDYLQCPLQVGGRAGRGGAGSGRGLQGWGRKLDGLKVGGAKRHM